ncbi:hypothetical protein [Nonomuraea gerenzanensis]|uniref:hypothetical protein n=1 Tax=Nonomuraea gerenzanensis TaxID=93944 RepID=UPI001CD93221|nr:hypothetical protein [Nonomuraea gerenzanensis]UBU16597.1 hypothetical protein LCN96_16745 [Nonomuraea gerenzanensis]
MSRRTRPAINPNTSHSVITTKARVCGWAIEPGETSDDGTTELILTRDDWKIVVAFQGSTALAAALQYPGRSKPSELIGSEQLARFLRGNREQMGRFRIDQRVLVGVQAGTVKDIRPDDETKVRLIVRYDGGAMGDPFTTHVRAEGKAAV